MGLATLAGLINRDKGHLSRVERGVDDRDVTPALVRDYERELRVTIRSSDMPPEQARSEAPEGQTDEPQVPEILPYVTEAVLRDTVSVPLHERVKDLVPADCLETPHKVGSADVARIEAATRVFRDWDNRWGGGLYRAAVLTQLRWVVEAATTSNCSTAKVRSRLLTALADLAGVAAFLSYDVDRQHEARSLWVLGLEASSEAGNVDLVGTTLRQLAHQSLHLNRVDEALRLVRLAYATTVDPAHHTSELALAEIAAYEGWCYAATGNVQACHRALGRAQDHFDNAEVEEAPPWLAHLDLAELTALRGHSYHVLAYREPSVAEHAEGLLRQAVAGRSDDYARSKTLNLIALAATFFQRQDHIEEGITVGQQALDGASSLTSTRARARLRTLDALAAPHANLPAVAEFRDQLDAVLADA
jgi:hypothetical protein